MLSAFAKVRSITGACICKPYGTIDQIVSGDNYLFMKPSICQTHFVQRSTTEDPHLYNYNSIAILGIFVVIL